MKQSKRPQRRVQRDGESGRSAVVWGREGVERRLGRRAGTELCKALNVRPRTLTLPLGRLFSWSNMIAFAF